MIVLIDGNSTLYRAYFAIRGLSTSKGFPTNAIYGFVQTVNKIEKEFKPEAISVAFDVAKKTFRNEIYKEYKAGRPPMPEDLVVQIPKIKEFLKLKGIPIWEFENYEADDLIATVASKYSQKDKVLIVSSDKDLFQLIDDNIMIYQAGKDQIITRKEAEEKFGVLPEQMADFLSLMGDSSDNIPGVKGIGEKTAAKLIREYNTLENLYQNIEKVSPPSLKEKLISGKESAFLSKKLIILKRDLDIKGIEIKKYKEDPEKLKDFYRELEFYSLLKEMETKVKIEGKVEGLSAFFKDDNIFLFDGKVAREISEKELLEIKEKVFTYQSKEIFKKIFEKGLKPFKNFEDIEIGSYLLDPDRGTPTLEYMFSKYLNSNVPQNPLDILKGIVILWERIEKKLEEEGLEEIYEKIEKPLIEVLSRMEVAGVYIDKEIIFELTKTAQEKIAEIEEKIYKKAGCSFNINSPKQLREILYDKLKCPAPEIKTEKKKELSTGEEALLQLKRMGYEIASLILEYREYFKLKSTYLDPLPKMLDEKGRVHTTFKQTQTATGRLSSQNPNLQNIPIRSEFGGTLRKAFSSPEGRTLVVGDYSQIELRLLAHFCEDPALMDSFFKGKDIHSSTASYLYKIDEKDVNSEMRRMAKTVNFGIIYGISPHGLAQNLGISREEAKEILDRYFKQFPKVKEFFSNLLEEARKTMKVSTIFGRIRRIPEINSKNFNIRSNAERMAINAPLQGSAADIIKIAMINIYRQLPEKFPSSEIVLQVH
ncbi:MAG: DNA polymerase, partial [Thermoanaerobaculia bacterium]